jgi:osmotically-inducible protein OsmY
MAARIRTDEIITKDVVDSLYWDSRVDASEVSVTVEDGIVTLSGTVPSYSARAAASECAWLVTGVRNVENQLKADLRTEVPSDSEIQASIEQTFTWNNDLYPFNLNVDVVEGWAILQGTVDTFWKKVRAEDMAFGMRGVIGVTNKLAVVPTQTIADESLAETIVNALDQNVNVNVDDVHVRVENGKVALTGAVPNWSAKQAAYDTARYTLGVKEVRDQVSLR